MKASSESLTAAGAPDADRFFQACRTFVDERLDQLIPPETAEPCRVHAAIRWSVFAGGKRFRPALLLATGDAFGASRESLLDAACALEMVHTYSLVHDDLPSMDDDRLRRGRPTCHVRFDEATAILAGDALQTLAFQTVAGAELLPQDVRITLVSEIATAAGTPRGMIAGQAFDLAAESRDVSGDELERIHRYKTGALITAAARCGAIIAGAPPADLAAISSFASEIGLLFQITDDLLDVTATVLELGKTPGKDVRAHKTTYPSVYGIDNARMRAADVFSRACSALENSGIPDTRLLLEIAGFILERKS